MGSVRTLNGRGTLFMDFRYLGKRCREYTALNDTPPNRKRLEKVLAKIEADIAAGTFDYAATFPNSRAVVVHLTVRRGCAMCGPRTCFSASSQRSSWHKRRAEYARLRCGITMPGCCSFRSSGCSIPCSPWLSRPAFTTARTMSLQASWQRSLSREFSRTSRGKTSWVLVRGCRHTNICFAKPYVPQNAPGNIHAVARTPAAMVSAPPGCAEPGDARLL